MLEQRFTVRLRRSAIMPGLSRVFAFVEIDTDGVFVGENLYLGDALAELAGADIQRALFYLAGWCSHLGN